jgi:hypothetical protein
MAVDDTDPLQQTGNKHKLVKYWERHIRPARNSRENAIERKSRWYDLVVTVRLKSSKERKLASYPTRVKDVWFSEKTVTSIEKALLPEGSGKCPVTLPAEVKKGLKRGMTFWK